MCSSNVYSLIQDFVGQKMAANEMFTAFDVSLQVQNQLKAKNEFDHNQHRHSHLKNDIHSICTAAISSGSYCRSLQDVGAPTFAFVYYPVGSDPANYVPLARKDSPATPATPFAIPIPVSTAPVPLPAVPVADLAAVVDDHSDKHVNRLPDGRGTVCVSAELLRAVNFQQGDQAYVYADGNKLVVSKTEPSQEHTSYTVDSSNNVRITKKTFDDANIGAKSYDFDVDKSENKVFVFAHRG